jgi:hypothetical protein
MSAETSALVLLLLGASAAHLPLLALGTSGELSSLSASDDYYQYQDSTLELVLVELES